jgi:hypothetical protein
MIDDKELDEKLGRLKILLDKGILTSEQFDKKKEELIDLFVLGQDLVATYVTLMLVAQNSLTKQETVEDRKRP